MHAPDAHSLLLTAVAHTDLDRARTAWRHLSAHLGGDDQTVRWLRHGAPQRLMPLLSVRSAALGLSGLVDLACEEATAVAWGLNVRIIEDVGPVLDAWRRAGIDALAMKGLGLLGDAYPEHRLRPLGDADVLVPDHRLDDAFDVLLAAGWRVGRRHRWHLAGHGTSVNLAKGTGVSIDVHRRMARNVPVHDQRLLWDGAEHVPVAHPLAGTGVRRPAPALHTAMLIAHASRPGGSLHHLVDLHHHLAVHADLRTDAGASALVTILDRHHLAVRARTVFDRLHDLFDTPLPTAAATITPSSDERADAERRIIAADRRADHHPEDGRRRDRRRQVADHIAIAASGHGPAVRLRALGGTLLRATVARLD